MFSRYFRSLLAAIWILLALVLFLIAALVAYKALQSFLHRLLHRRRSIFQPALDRLIQGDPSSALALRPRLWGDAGLLEDLLVESFGQVSGSLREDVRTVAFNSGLIERRLRQAGSRKIHVRAEAYNRLGLLGAAKAVPMLAAGLAREDYAMKIVIVRALGRIHSAEALPVLLSALGEGHGPLSRFLMHALVDYGYEAVPGLMSLADRPGAAQADAIDLLGQLHALAALNDLILTLRTAADPNVRAAAAKALGMLAHPDAVEVLRAGLKDGMRLVRANSAWALGCVGDPSACPDLAALFADNYWWARVRAAEALVKIGPPGLDRLRRLSEDADSGNRALAREVLAVSALKR